MTVYLEKRRFHYFQANQLRLRYASCKGTENSTHFLISTTLDSCGTLQNETRDFLIFSNEVHADALIIDNVVTRSHDIKLPFYCRYSRKKLLSLSFTPKRIYVGNESNSNEMKQISLLRFRCIENLSVGWLRLKWGLSQSIQQEAQKIIAKPLDEMLVYYRYYPLSLKVCQYPFAFLGGKESL